MLHVQSCFFFLLIRNKSVLHVQSFFLPIRKKVCCTCKVVFLPIRSNVVVFYLYRCRCFHPAFSVTRFYIFIEETINIKESFAFSPGKIYTLRVNHSAHEKINEKKKRPIYFVFIYFFIKGLKVFISIQGNNIILIIYNQLKFKIYFYLVTCMLEII